MLNDIIINYVAKLIKSLKITDYAGIIVYGSYVGERNNKLSDLDVMIIKEHHETQDCGSQIIDGIRIEYFVQGLKRLYELIKKEIENNDPSHLTKFATCEVLFDKDGKTKEFINYAREIYNTKIENTFGDNEKFSLFSISNRIEDLESLLDDDSFYAVYFVTLEKIRVLYSKIYGIIDLPLTKINRIYTDDDFARKYISSPVHHLPNAEFINKYLECLKIVQKDAMLSNLKELYSISFNSLGFNSKEFCLRYTKKAPFKV